MQYRILRTLFASAAIFGLCAALNVAHAQRGGRGGDRPPGKVVLGAIEMGVLAPQTEPTGTVFFKELAQLATEVSAKVLSVDFEEGQHVKQGQILVQLDASVLKKDRDALLATVERRRTELEDAKVRFERAKDLLEDDVTTPQEYDNLRFAMQGMQHQVAESQADVDRLEILIEKHIIRAPFDAVVLERTTEVGEWKNTGASVAAIALENLYDVIVHVHEEYLPFLTIGLEVPVYVVGSDLVLHGEIVAVIQRGDVQTRTFPVKIRVEYDEPLYEGMGIKVSIPREAAVECLVVQRDAVLLQNGGTFVYTADDGVVKRHEVQIMGYDGLEAGIATTDLGPGDLVIVKGHERLHEGDEVIAVEDVLSSEYLAGGA